METDLVIVRPRHGEHECVYRCATSEMTQIVKNPAMEWIVLSELHRIL